MKSVVKIGVGAIIFALTGFMGYKVVSIINKKMQLFENILHIPKFTYKDIKGMGFTNLNLKPTTPIIFVYFNSECDFCQHEALMIKHNIDKLTNSQIIFISSEPQEKIIAFAQNFGLINFSNIIFLIDDKHTFNLTFDVSSLPCIILYNKDQFLIEKIKGQIKIEYILKKLNL